MSTNRNVAVIIGSLRKQSLNRKLALVLMELAPPSLTMNIVEIGQLPLYNQDHEETPPVAWTAFRDQVGPSDAVLFVTPEYNRSIPGVLKNAVDVGSRPYGKSIWEGKSAAVVSASPGAAGGFGANYHLRQSLVGVNVAVMAQPEVCLGGADKHFDAEGKLVNPSTAEFLGKFTHAFAAWIERFVAK
ncbi:NADPH-dependent oxidoreductase [Pseudolysobacter antarcticus]|uniref:NADPH-dependent oxidoreductase n=1 Tax=Pseudolysobacter antarcticus TaxID=2511995 RepID=A0A411HJX6_9GAMM|nr:NAD(P)H-dependent oxidoreductase [Pseudolysobacter antarcticus]QBB70798.1 NADPH-dependent oxidoreductase [Pseudolysobacter antarcticus]